MLKAYKPIKHEIFKAHDLVVFLVEEVWCKADDKQCRTHLNDELTKLYQEHKWFKKGVNQVYKICKELNHQGKLDFRNAFLHNNKIEDLCRGNCSPINLSILNQELLNAIEKLFKRFYKGLLGWSDIKTKYGSKKEYYDELITENVFKECPCCGFGEIKTRYSKGYSSLDHYLPQKYYPFSVVNFHNLVPLCHRCNSDEKGQTDIIENGQKVFYPFASDHPNIAVSIALQKQAVLKLVKKTFNEKDPLDEAEVTIDFAPKDERVDAWNSIFGIRSRYFEKVALNRKGWFDQVRVIYRDPDVRTDTINDAFDRVIKTDPNGHLAFLKVSFLENLKTYAPLVRAAAEVSGDSKMN